MNEALNGRYKNNKLIREEANFKIGMIPVVQPCFTRRWLPRIRLGRLPTAR